MATRPMINTYVDGQLVYRPMTDAEYADLQAQQASAAAAVLAQARADKISEITAKLRDTDKWVVRAVEEKTTVQTDRLIYRANLRLMLTTAAISPNPASIVVPIEPPYIVKKLG